MMSSESGRVGPDGNGLAGNDAADLDAAIAASAAGLTERLQRRRCRLRVDTWDPEYGTSVELSDADDLGPANVRLDLEGPWSPLTPALPEILPSVAFIDGVRRIDIRLFAEVDAEFAPAVAGSWAVGVAWSARPPLIDAVRIGRTLVVGGGLAHQDLVGAVGDHALTYSFAGVTGVTPADPVQGLQNAMRAAEGQLAAETFASGRAALMMLDGPLTYFAANGPVVGVIKRQSRPYLPPERASLLATLEVGQRTPLFAIVNQQLERFSWYARIGRRRSIDGTMTGIVRLEVSAEVGVTEAARIANQATAILPLFATEIGRDARAPQNLYPVAQLEATLRHRLGDPALIRRALESALWSDL
ncbi:MAG: hypothetical protein KIT43_08230 [Bauldia sp.]|nr:hypothetical protein [Bauldia sp.]MCW5716889.1 hypothetical protein [Bauldia sp.]